MSIYSGFGLRKQENLYNILLYKALQIFSELQIDDARLKKLCKINKALQYLEREKATEPFMSLAFNEVLQIKQYRENASSRVPSQTDPYASYTYRSQDDNTQDDSTTFNQLYDINNDFLKTPPKNSILKTTDIELVTTRNSVQFQDQQRTVTAPSDVKAKSAQGFYYPKK